MPALATVDSHLIYTCVNNERHGQQDLILLERNHFGKFVLMSVGTCSIHILTVLIIMSLSPWKVCLKKKDAYHLLTL